MANSKQNFLGLVKVTGDIANYTSITDKTGKLIFAHVTDQGNDRYIINANGIEYNIATKDVFESLEARVAALESWRLDVDSSIDRLDSSVSALETLLADYSDWRTNTDASIDALQAKDIEIDASIDRIDASIENHEARIKALEDNSDVDDLSTYVHNVVDASIDDLQAKDVEIDTSITEVSTRLASALVSADIASVAVADNSTLITLTTTNSAGTVSNTSVKVSGSNYVNIDGAANNVTVSVATASVATAGEGEGLADAKDVKDYVDDVLQDLEQALVFKGAASNDASLPDDASAGWTYVADASWESTEAGRYIESGDLLIRGEGSWVVVERNLDGAVTAGEELDNNNLILGNGNQAVKDSGLAFSDLETAIANANNAIQDVDATSSNAYVTATAAVSSSTATVTIDLANAVVETSAALDAVTATGSFADAKAIKDLVDAKAADVKVEATLNSSTPNYVDASASVDATGRVISAEVGVKVVDLSTATTKGDGLADAFDVREKLEEVEDVMAAATTAMAETLGMEDDFSVNWTNPAWSTYSYKDAIEAAAAASGVTEIQGITGAVSLTTNSVTAGEINFSTNSSTISAGVVGWDALVDRVDKNEDDIADVSDRLNDLSTYVRTTVNASIDDLQAKDVEIDASIDRLDASVSALEDALDDFKVKSIEGEAGISTRANDEFVAVSASEPDANGKVSLDASVQLAEDVTLPAGATHETATGLATDGWVKDFLAWEVIGND